MDTSPSNDKRAQESGDVVTPSAKRQKLGERKSDVAGGDGYLVPLRLTARSGYLAVEEVARLLLFTGRTFMGNIFCDLQNNLGQTIPAITGGTQRIADVGPFRYVHNVEVTRHVQAKSFGLSIRPVAGLIGCQICSTGALVRSSEIIEKKDVIISINGKNVEEWKCSEVLKEIGEVRGNTIIFSFRRFHPDVKMQMWKCICQHKWRDAEVLSRLMQCVGKRCSNGEADWEGLFQKFCQRGLGYEDLKYMTCYDFLLTVHDCIDATLDSTPVTCLFLDIKSSVSLMKAGLTGWLKFDSPINVGTFTSLKEVRNKINTWSIGLHVLRRLDKKSRIIDMQPLDSNCRSLSNPDTFDHDFSDEESDEESVEKITGKRWYFFTRKRRGRKSMVVDGNLDDLITNSSDHNSKVDIEFKRNLRCSVHVHKDGKHECCIDAISVGVLIKDDSMIETNGVMFSQSDSVKRVKPGITLANFLALTDGWE